jgi:hypothetical protein
LRTCAGSAIGCGGAPKTALYADGKRRLVQRDWTYVQNYADAKAEVVAAIMARARSQADHLGDCC